MPVRSPTRSVFINCPFDEKAGYKKLFDALIFTVYDCGFFVRCGLETIDSGESRFQKICELIRECPYAIHDISKTELDTKTGLPRFNMPLELGLFLGANEFGRGRRKVCLILDTERDRYDEFCSDLSGVDIAWHANQPKKLVREVRDWFQSRINQEPAPKREFLPDGDVIFGRFREFVKDLPALCAERRLNRQRLKYGDYTPLMVGWLEAHPL
jgi:hypothetical protein